jgi:hypothetical protein
MATVSFTKDIVIKEKEAIKKFENIVANKKPVYPISKELASDKTMERGRELLKQYFSR